MHSFFCYYILKSEKRNGEKILAKLQCFIKTSEGLLFLNKIVKIAGNRTFQTHEILWSFILTTRDGLFIEYKINYRLFPHKKRKHTSFDIHLLLPIFFPLILLFSIFIQITATTATTTTIQSNIKLINSTS